jgi:GNAT superfamily N-acetyltransferase
MIIFRKMEPADIDAGLALCRAAKWNQQAHDWEIFLRLSPDGCRVAILDGKITGTLTTLLYQNSFSWIGMVLVDPANQRQGIGIQLLKEALNILANEETIKLDATPAGREVYLKLNFVDEYSLSRLNAFITTIPPEITDARQLTKNDWSILTAFDREIFGADRLLLLQGIWEGAPQYAYIIEENSKIQGYCLGRRGYDHTHIGPVVTGHLEIAKKLVLATLRNCQGQSVIIDVMHFEPAWIEWLMLKGFKAHRSFTRMYLGANDFPGIPEKQYAIAGPEFG